jgi:hypothetical protein
MAELMQPMKKVLRQWALTSGSKPLACATGNNTNMAKPTRKKAMGMGPKCWDPQRMNTNDDPQMMDKAINSGSQRRKGRVFTGGGS